MLLDFIIIFVFLIIVSLGYKKGFSQMLLSLGAFLLSFFLVWAIFNFIGDAFFESEYGNKLTSGIAEGIETRISEFTDIGSDFSFFDTNAENAEPNAFSAFLAKKVLKAILSIPLLIISFILLKLLIFLLRRIVATTTKLPVVGTLDSLLGSVLGAIIGVFVVTVLYFVLGYVQVLPAMDFLKEQFAESYIVIFINSIF